MKKMRKHGEKIYFSEEEEALLKKMNARILEGNSTYDIVLEVKIKAKAGAKREEVSFKDGQISVATFSPPQDGKANAAIIKTFSHFLGLAPADCHLVQGEKSKTKTFKIGLNQNAKNSPENVAKKLSSIFEAIEK